MKKSILILNTGGTISSVKTDEGYQPQQGYLQKALQKIHQLHRSEMPSYTILEYRPLLDSSNLGLDEWNRLATDIEKYYKDFDGFIILHGTDTLAYTASILSFVLENLSKPLILTGSQIPLSELRNDAEDNIINSLWLCATIAPAEVTVYFNQKLLRGNRCRKVSSHQFNAFDSPNFPCLGKIGIEAEIRSDLLLKPSQEAFRRQPIQPQFIANFRLFPGFSVEVLAAILQQPIKALILETYGAGNAPNLDAGFLASLKAASDRGIIIVNASQCHQGRVEMNQYATGHSLEKAGLISGNDMSPEAIHAKLLYLLSKYEDPVEVKRQMQGDLRGEVSL